MHRSDHLSQAATANRKFRVVAAWTLALPFRREIVSLADVHAPCHTAGADRSARSPDTLRTPQRTP